MSTNGQLFKCASFIKLLTKLAGLVQGRHYHHLIECNLLLP
jgi:hypothetical protein